MREDRESAERGIRIILGYVISRGVLLFVLVLHPCSTMDQTDRQSLIGFGKELCVCVSVCEFVCPLMHVCMATLSLSLSL